LQNGFTFLPLFIHRETYKYEEKLNRIIKGGIF
jgi:hypothetical protein